MTELVLDTELTTEQREHLGLVRVSPEPLLSIIDDSGLLRDRGGKAGVGSDSVRSSLKRGRNDAGAEFARVRNSWSQSATVNREWRKGSLEIRSA